MRVSSTVATNALLHAPVGSRLSVREDKCKLRRKDEDKDKDVYQQLLVESTDRIE